MCVYMLIRAFSTFKGWPPKIMHWREEKRDVKDVKSVSIPCILAVASRDFLALLSSFRIPPETECWQVKLRFSPPVQDWQKMMIILFNCGNVWHGPYVGVRGRSRSQPWSHISTRRRCRLSCLLSPPALSSAEKEFNSTDSQQPPVDTRHLGTCLVNLIAWHCLISFQL